MMIDSSINLIVIYHLLIWILREIIHILIYDLVLLDIKIMILGSNNGLLIDIL